MLKWSKGKLQRLASHRESRDIDRDSRREGISKVVNLIGKLALEGLLQNRLSLSEADKTQLRECCGRLPSTEVLGAFYSVRSRIVDGEDILMYYAPHKSIQEFNAAQHIVHQIQGGSSGGSVWQLLLDTSQDPTQLANLLEDTAEWKIRFGKEPTEVTNLKNLFIHVLGLLSHPEPDMSPLPGAIQEVVDLLHKTGMKRCNPWLELLEDTEVNSTALERIAQHITRNSVHNDTQRVVDLPDQTGMTYNHGLGEIKESLESFAESMRKFRVLFQKMRVSDTTVISATALLPLIPHREVEIVLWRRQGHINQLGQATANHTLTELSLYHHYTNPDLCPASDPILRDLPRRNDLKKFVGHVSKEGLLLLQGCRHLESLRLAVCGDNNAPTILSTLTDVLPSLPSLSQLCLHVPVKTVTPRILTPPLPDITGDGVMDGVLLVLSGVEEELLEETCQIAAALQPRKNGYWGILFPRCNLKADGWRRLIDSLANGGVRTGKEGIWVQDTVVTQQEEEDLNTLTWTRMSCEFCRWHENDLWQAVLLPPI